MVTRFSSRKPNIAAAIPATISSARFVHGAIAGEPLTDAEIAFNCILLILGGQETTRNATSGGMQALSNIRPNAKSS